MAVLAAARSTLGRWQIKLENDEDWRDLDENVAADEADLAVPEGLLTERTYRGPIRIEDYMAKLSCENENTADVLSLTGEEDASCWQEVRLRH